AGEAVGPVGPLAGGAEHLDLARWAVRQEGGQPPLDQVRHQIGDLLGLRLDEEELTVRLVPNAQLSRPDPVRVLDDEALGRLAEALAGPDAGADLRLQEVLEDLARAH